MSSLPYMPADAVQKKWKCACFIDVETTGLGGTDEIVELAAVLFAYDPTSGEIKGIVDEYVGLNDPGRRIPVAAVRIHGITDKMVRGQHLDLTRIEGIMQRAAFIVAHNAPFDSRFVWKISSVAREKTWKCSMSGVKWAAKGFSSKGLQNLLRAHEITPTGAHRALADVYAALTLLSFIDESTGAPYFRELAARCGKKWLPEVEDPSTQTAYAEAAPANQTSRQRAGATERSGCGAAILLVVVVAVACMLIAISV